MHINRDFINISCITLFQKIIFQIHIKCDWICNSKGLRLEEGIYWTWNTISFFSLLTQISVMQLAFFPTLCCLYTKQPKITSCCKSLFLWQSSKHTSHYWMSTFFPCRRKLEMALKVKLLYTSGINKLQVRRCLTLLSRVMVLIALNFGKRQNYCYRKRLLQIPAPQIGIAAVQNPSFCSTKSSPTSNWKAVSGRYTIKCKWSKLMFLESSEQVCLCIRM